MEHEDITVRFGAIVLRCERIAGRATYRAIQAVDERLEILRFKLIEPSEIGDYSLAYTATLDPIGLDELEVTSSA
jgi:hypothetical protein